MRSALQEGFPLRKSLPLKAESDTRENFARNAKLNEVSSQIEIHSACGISELRNALKDTTRATIICDVEGHENDLLDPTAVPTLKIANILVETHEFVVPNVTQIISTRFAKSHDITVIRQQSRSSADFPWRTLITALFPERYLDLVVSEGRPEQMVWLWMRAKESSQ